MAATRLLTAGDLQEALVLAGLAAPAWTVPSGAWPAICRRLAAASNTLARRPVPDVPADLTAALGRAVPDDEAARIRRSKQLTYFEERLQVLASLPPRRWRPTIDIRGREYVDGALSEGKGAILWVNEFVGSDLVAKAASDQASLRLSHLTRPEHGFARSRLGMRFLNPIRRRAEDRFLAERVTMQGETGITALRTLERRLAENRVVSITVGADAVRKQPVPFLGARLTVATGPVSLALSTGAPLLPVFTVRRDPSLFTVTFDSDVVSLGDVGRAETTASTLQTLARRLEPYVRAHPELWRGWGTVFTGA